MNIAGKVAIVTGGASGLGEATVRAYVEKGASVAIFDMDAKRGDALVHEVGEEKVTFFNVNVSDEESVSSAIASVTGKYGALHICNNYAGISYAAKILGKDGPHPLDSYKNILDINLTGTFNVARLVSEQMAKNEPYNEHGGRGVIINTASVAAIEGQVGQTAYSASKGGVVGMTLPMARDLASLGIRVNTIIPGAIHTPLFDLAPDYVHKTLINQVVYPKRLGRPEEIAHLSVMMVENEYLNGECIRLDGAIRMQPR